MKNLLMMLFFFLLLLSCNVADKKSIENINKKAIQGFWTCKEVEIDHTRYVDTVFVDRSENVKNIISTFRSVSWLINEDSIWEFDYPCEYYGAFSFKIKADSIYFNNNKIASGYLELKNNILKISDPVISKDFAIQNFIRDTVDLEKLIRLRKEKVNLNCLLGTLKLINPHSSLEKEKLDESGFPSMPANIKIQTENEARTIIKDQIITLTIGGIKRLFYIKRFDWNNYNGDYIRALNDHFQNKYVITLNPGEWWKGEKVNIKYEKE